MTGRLALCLAVVALVSSAAALGGSYALVVGVSRYSDPSVADLEYAASDAREVALLLETACGFSRSDILMLTEEEATRDGIVAGFAWLGERAGPGDTLVIYMAGHGTTTVDRDGDEADGDGVDEAFLPQDAALLDPATYLVDDELGARIAALECGAVTLFLDACYSGGQSRWVGAPVPEIDARDSVARDVLTAGLGGPARAVLAACLPQELAYENPTLRSGVFTHFLLEGLNSDSADANGDDVLALSELSEYVIGAVSTWSATRAEKQTPVLDMPPGHHTPVGPGLSPGRRAAPRLVVHFPFDDDLDEKAGGYSTVNRDAEIVPGIIGSAGRFDNAVGHTTYVRTTDAYAPLEGPFAVALWFRSDRIVSGQGFLFSSHARYNDYGPEYGVVMAADGSLTFRTDDERGQNHRQDLATTTYRWDDGAWHHLVVQRLADGRKEIWVDGCLEATETYSIQDLRTAGQPLTVGGSAYAAWSSNRSFVGDLDDFRVYSGALDAERISALVSMGVPDLPVTFADAVVADAVRSASGLAAGAALSTHDALRVRTLEIDAERDLDLAGIEACRNLRTVRLRDAGIYDLGFVRSLPALVDLALPGNRIARLEPLAVATSVEVLDLSHNQIADLTPLAKIPFLAYLSLSWNEIGDLGPLVGLTKMKELALRGNAIIDPSPLAALTSLRRLDLGQNNVRNVQPLVSLDKLVSLALDGNGLSDVEPLGRMPGLEEINLSWNAIADVAPLAGLEWLGDYTMDTLGSWHGATLELAGNLIADPRPLLDLVGLGPGDSLDVSWNPFDAVTAEEAARVFAELRARGIVVLTD
ncbi:MAG: LamG-like jellyroll fold domain-containing protein [Candidatus Bipolaricaulota bacterium]